MTEINGTNQAPTAATFLTAEELRNIILQANDLPVIPQVVPEWGGVTVYVRSMTAKERDDWQASYFFLNKDAQESADGTPGKVTVKNLSASLLVKMLCADPEGKVLIFKESDIDALGDKSAAVINRLQEALRAASGVTKEDEDAIEKNLNAQSVVSG